MKKAVARRRFWDGWCLGKGRVGSTPDLKEQWNWKRRVTVSMGSPPVRAGTLDLGVYEAGWRRWLIGAAPLALYACSCSIAGKTVLCWGIFTLFVLTTWEASTRAPGWLRLQRARGLLTAGQGHLEMNGTSIGQVTDTSLQAPCSPAAQTLPFAPNTLSQYDRIWRNVFCRRGDAKQVAELAHASTKESFGKQGKVEGIWERSRKEIGKVSLERAGKWNRTGLSSSVGGNLRDTSWKEPSSTSAPKRELADSALELPESGNVEKIV